MPYYGLLDQFGRELRSGGYHRLDAANARYKISPPSVKPADHLTFVNADSIQWPPAGAAWAVEALAIFDEADSPNPLVTTPISRGKLSVGDIILIPAGGLKIGWHGRRDGDNEPVPPPEIDRLENLLSSALKENEMLRKENARLRAELEKARAR